MYNLCMTTASNLNEAFLCVSNPLGCVLSNGAEYLALNQIRNPDLRERAIGPESEPSSGAVVVNGAQAAQTVAGAFGNAASLAGPQAIAGNLFKAGQTAGNIEATHKSWIETLDEKGAPGFIVKPETVTVDGRRYEVEIHVDASGEATNQGTTHYINMPAGIVDGSREGAEIREALEGKINRLREDATEEVREELETSGMNPEEYYARLDAVLDDKITGYQGPDGPTVAGPGYGELRAGTLY